MDLEDQDARTDNASKKEEKEASLVPDQVSNGALRQKKRRNVSVVPKSSPKSKLNLESKTVEDQTKVLESLSKLSKDDLASLQDIFKKKTAVVKELAHTALHSVEDNEDLSELDDDEAGMYLLHPEEVKMKKGLFI